MYARLLDLPSLLKKKSFFLFGPRGTGKSTLIERALPHARCYDLLDADVFAALARHPRLIEEEQTADEIVAIDEVQKLPSILDEVHRLIAKRHMRFLLTGSSARKLKRGAANLLAGRAWEARLYPLCSQEITDFNLVRYLNRGGLPDAYVGDDPAEELKSYANLYLREEIQAEGLTRNVPAFARFLDVIALANGEEIHHESLASDCGVSAQTVANYLEILADTLVGFTLAGYTKTRKRKAIKRGKHYLFDIGVTNALAKRGAIVEGSELFGRALEHFIVLEMRAYLSYRRRDESLSYWRSTSQFEVDLIVGDALAVEVKATKLVQPKHLRGLRALKEEGLHRRYCVVSLDARRRTTEEGIEIWPWAAFLRALWGDALL
jgi:predicted AAA+ superfamily ATPase